MIDIQMTIHTYGTSPNEKIREYINIRYERWLDFARFKCSQAGLEGEENDVLNTVLLDVLQKDEQLLMKLFSKKKKEKGFEYSELDFFILRMLNLNINSVTSPYRHKNRPIPGACDVKLERLKIADEIDTDEEDTPAEMLKQFRLMTWVLKGLRLTDRERLIVEFKFLHGNRLSSFECIERESRKTIFDTYNKVLSAIHHVLYYYGYTQIKPARKLNGRVLELADQFVRSHKVSKSRKSNKLVNV